VNIRAIPGKREGHRRAISKWYCCFRLNSSSSTLFSDDLCESWTVAHALSLEHSLNVDITTKNYILSPPVVNSHPMFPRITSCPLLNEARTLSTDSDLTASGTDLTFSSTHLVSYTDKWARATHIAVAQVIAAYPAHTLCSSSLTLLPKYTSRNAIRRLSLQRCRTNGESLSMRKALSKAFYLRQYMSLP
jgi:hypothetical protein